MVEALQCYSLHGGTIIVSFGDLKCSLSSVLQIFYWKTFFLLFSGILCSVYNPFRKKLPDDCGKSGHVSMAQFLVHVGLFNIFIFIFLLIAHVQLYPTLISGKGKYLFFKQNVFLNRRLPSQCVTYMYMPISLLVLRTAHTYLCFTYMYLPVSQHVVQTTD